MIGYQPLLDEYLVTRGRCLEGKEGHALLVTSLATCRLKPHSQAISKLVAGLTQAEMCKGSWVSPALEIGISVCRR